VIHVSDKSVLQFGVGVGVKQFSKAVDRNKVKRLVREAYRLQKTAVQTQLEEKRLSMTVFFIYTGKEIPSYQDVYENIGNCLSRLSRLIQEYK
jgi:ribonuclease P protein component